MADFDKNAVIGRIIRLRTEYAGTRGRSKFANALGISPSTYSYYENDRLAPIDILLKISELTGTDLHWILTGKTADTATKTAPESKCQKMLKQLTQSDPNSENAVMAFIELLAEKQNAEKRIPSTVPVPQNEKPGWIPVLGRTAAGMVHFWNQTQLPQPDDAVVQLDQLVEKYTGKAVIASEKGNINLDLQLTPLAKKIKSANANLVQLSSQSCKNDPDQMVQFLDCQEIRSLFPDAFALQIDGDSMSPRINDSDIIVLSPSVPAAQGQIAVISIKNQIGVTCKIIRTAESNIHLIPINERYDTKIVPADSLIWALAVLCHIAL